MTTIKKLNEHDQAVLDAVFNPTLIGGPPDFNYNEILSDDIKDPEEEQSTALTESQQLEIESVKLAENGEYDKSLVLIERAIQITPNRASLYNNRAQTYRLAGNDTAAFDDLENALKLSNNSGRTGCRAFCQRGILRRKNKDDVGAKNDFEKAAKLGSQFARNQLIELNPYAALCNQMLREAFDKLH